MAFPTNITPQAYGDGDFIAGVVDTLYKQYVSLEQTICPWIHAYTGAALRHGAGLNAVLPVPGQLDASTTQLPAQADPAALVVTDDEVSIALRDDGAFMTFMDTLMQQKDLPAIAEISEIMMDQAVRSLDLIAGTPAIGGSNLIYVNDRAAPVNLVAGDVLEGRHFVQARALLRQRKARAFSGAQNGTPGGMYRAFLSPATVGDLFLDGGNAGSFTDAVRYTTNAPFIAGLIGTFHGFEIYEADQLTSSELDAGVGADGGAGLGEADLITTQFVGADYLRHTLYQPFTVLGPSKAGDQMERAWKLAWRKRWGVGRVREAAGLRIRHRAANAINP